MAESTPPPYPAVPAAMEFDGGQEYAVSKQVVVVATHYPSRTREFIEDAALAVARLNCAHGSTEAIPFPSGMSVNEKRRLARAHDHPGLCG